MTARWSVGQRLTAVLVAGGLAACVVATLEWVRLGDARSASAWLAIVGFVSPLVLGVSLLGGIASAWFEPQAPLGLRGLWRRMFDQPELLSKRSALFTLGAVATVLWLLTLGSVGLSRLLADQPALGAAAGFAAVSVVSGVVWFGALLYWQAALRCVFDRWPRALVAVCPVAVFLVVGALLIAFGETSGAGGIWRMWGVFRRDELDLAVPLYLLLALVFGYELPAWMPRLPVAVGALPLLGSLGVWGYSSQTDAGTVFEVERKTALAKPALHAYQAWGDRDGDGFSAKFGGGDCNDADPKINPEAQDIAGNGIDEDCSGSDATAIVKQTGEQTGADQTADGSKQQAAAAAEGLPQRMNVLLISIDTLRHDLGYTGYERPISPNIDKLAARSTVYDKAYSLASYTSKSLGPMLIGRYGSETNRGWMHFNKYPEQDRMLQERLSAVGVHTLSVQGHWYFKADTGLGRGFDVLDLSAAPTRPQGEGDKTVNSPELSDAAIRLLGQPALRDKPFYMWVHYLDPHAEYVAHKEFDFGRKGRDRYDGEIAFTDHHVGRLLDALADSPFSDNTIVIVTSDHGEAFGEHGLIRHGFELWEELVRVPWIVYIPGQPARHIDKRRSLIDLVPTVLEVFHVPAPSGETDFVSGQSVLGEWLGQPLPERPVFIDMPAGPYNGDRQAFIENNLKLITANSRPVGLYDLAADPGETQNLTTDKERTQAALERMKQFRSGLKTIVVKPK